MNSSQLRNFDLSIERGLRPPPNLEASLWAEHNVVLDSRTGPIGGLFSLQAMNYVREVIDTLGDNKTESVALMCSVQSLKSTVGIVTLARAIAVDPGPAMWVSQNQDEAKIMLRDRMMPIFRGSPTVRPAIPYGANKPSRWEVPFLTMPFYMAWGGSRARMQSKPIRWLFLDECDLYPENIAEAEDRCTAFWNSRTVYMSTPGDVGGSIHQKYLQGDQRMWHFRCVQCGHEQTPVWGAKDKPGGMKWFKGDTLDDVTPWYECGRCEFRYVDTPNNRRWISTQGRWISMNPNAVKEPRTVTSFTWNALISPMMSYKKLVISWLQAIEYQRMGILYPLKDFVTKRLAKPWDEYEYEKTWIPEPVLYEPTDKWELEHRRYLCADVQKDCLYYTCRAWSADGESRLIDEGKIIDFDELRAKQLELGVPDQCVCPDSGYESMLVYQQCSRYGWTAMKGEDVQNFKVKQGDVFVPALWKYGRLPQHVRFALRGGKPFKLLLFASQLAQDTLDLLIRGRGRPWSFTNTVSDTYKKHLGAYKRSVKRNSRGVPTPVWVYGKEDHLLACEREQVVCAVAGGQLQTQYDKNNREDKPDGSET